MLGRLISFLFILMIMIFAYTSGHSQGTSVYPPTGENTFDSKIVRITGEGNDNGSNFSEIVVSNLNDAGAGSLRAAILTANASPGLDSIIFVVSGVITPLTELPPVTDDSTKIMGGTAPSGARSVIIDGGSAGAANGLILGSSYNTISEIVLTNWETACLDIGGNYNDIIGSNIGVNAAGDTRASYGTGIRIDGNNNTIGGCDFGQRNVLSGGVEAVRSAIIIYGDSNTVKNAFVGMSVFGTMLIDPPTSVNGIGISGNDNIIGLAGCPNYLGGNQFAITTDLLGRNNIIQSNVIGLAPDLEDTVPNWIGIWAVNNGNVFGPANLIAGNNNHGIYIRGDSNIFVDNVISGNAVMGIFLEYGSFNQIGGYEEGQANRITSNGYHGIIMSRDSDSNMVLGNVIAGPPVPPGLKNNSSGVAIQKNSHGNLIDSNVIANNGRNGIEVLDSCKYNTFSRNYIFNSDDLGIDLNYDGVTLNDPGDVDTGANDMLNFPEIDSVNMNPYSSFMVFGRAEGNARVEFFIAHPAKDTTKPPDPTGYGEAYSYIGYTACDAAGTFSYIIPTSAGLFSQVTATATDTLGNTSEFCKNFLLMPKPLIIVAYGFPPGKDRADPSSDIVNIWVTDPNGDYIGKDASGTLYQTITEATYDENGADSVTIEEPVTGEYTIEIISQDGAPDGATYAVGIQLDGSNLCISGENLDAPASGVIDTFYYQVEEGYHYINGDANRDETLNILDITYLISFLYKSGPTPDPYNSGDSNCDLTVNILDITYLIAYLYKGGPNPCEVF